MQKKTIYVLGTGCSHNGSACLLKDGKIIVAIEKERLTRKKRDGINDTQAIQYCLDAEGITMNDIALVVENGACFEPTRDYFGGERIFAKYPDVPYYKISHHLAHAYSTIGTCPFEDNFNIIIIDGSGSTYDQCIDLSAKQQPDPLWTSLPHLFFEKDSYYSYRNGSLTTIYKDFNEFGLALKNDEKYTITKHSIGNAYSMFSSYCFRNMQDAGKLMGLAPYGRNGIFKDALFELRDGRVWINYDVVDTFHNLARSFDVLKKNFQYYADIACWVQKEAERALLYTFESRLAQDYADNVCYAGGVALNAVANAKIIEKLKIKNLYMQPAAGDNGIAIGCAFYGWLEILKKQRVMHNASTFFGKPYSNDEVLNTLNNYEAMGFIQKQKNGQEITQAVRFRKSGNRAKEVAQLLAEGKVIGLFQGGSEFGPRALGHRSIIADPRIKNLRNYINGEIKFREDFRPFAPAVLKEDILTYFKKDQESPYMILVNEVKEEWKDVLDNVVHRDNSSRVQTVTKDWNNSFYEILTEFKGITGLSVLLNTSFNIKGMPIVETPKDALTMFVTSKLDCLVMEDYIIEKVMEPQSALNSKELVGVN